MVDDKHAREELHRRFEEIVLGSGLLPAHNNRRPELRRQPLRQPRVFELRIGLERAKPPIWRRVLVWSDLSLEGLHHVIQVLFGLNDMYPWRFGLGGDPMDRHTQVFLCPYEAADPDPWEADSPQAQEVRIDETLQFPGDWLHYLYAGGGSWDLMVRLTRVLPADTVLEHPWVTGGARVAPSEESGGTVEVELSASERADPPRFDAKRLNESLAALFEPSQDMLGVPLRLIEMGIMLGMSGPAPDHGKRIARLIQDSRVLDPELLAESASAIFWFLDRALDDGIPLTASGYLKPDDVVVASRVVPRVRDFGKHNREVNEPEVRLLRQALQQAGLLRRHKGKLYLTRAGAAAQADVQMLRAQLIARTIPEWEGFEQDATMLVLLHAATAQVRQIDVHFIAEVLTTLGYRVDGHVVSARDIYDLPVVGLLGNITLSRDIGYHRDVHVSRTASMLAREILLQSGFGPEG